MTSTLYENLDKFTLVSHGDQREQEWAELILPAFSAYETFWRRYIVPLTNRVDPEVLDPEKWIYLRPKVGQVHEKMAMHHYSVFHFLARANQRIRSGKVEFPEDVFSLLDACGDNVRDFFGTMRKILGDFGKPADFLPLQKNEFCNDADLSKAEKERGAFVEVQGYRDTILHNPVLGYVIAGPRLKLPRREFLDEVKYSWRKAAVLTTDQRVELQELYDRLFLQVTEFLQSKWTQIISTLDSVQATDKFKKQWALEDRLLPIAPPLEIIRTTTQPVPASPAVLSVQASPRYSPTASAAMVQSFSPYPKKRKTRAKKRKK